VSHYSTLPDPLQHELSSLMQVVPRLHVGTRNAQKKRCNSTTPCAHIVAIRMLDQLELHQGPAGSWSLYKWIMVIV
jgi:hypothetical protein